MPSRSCCEQPSPRSGRRLSSPLRSQRHRGFHVPSRGWLQLGEVMGVDMLITWICDMKIIDDGKNCQISNGYWLLLAALC